MGWLDSPAKARTSQHEYQSFAEEILKKEKIGRIAVLGMGGSSLIPEVFASLLEGAHIQPPACLGILDSTDPEQVATAGQGYAPDQSLYIIASKSGGTAETMAGLDYFWQLSEGDSSRFVVITDPGTTLDALAQERHFRKIFNADETVGGRFSALTDFGMLPAALMDMDLNRLLDRADRMRNQCGEHVPAARNPGLALGAVLGEGAIAGRDKLTILSDAPFAAFTFWIEQLIAESSGKEGRGILPVPLEPIGEVSVYGNDRLFIYIRQSGELDESIKALREAGHPVIDFAMPDLYDVGAEIYRWEVAIAVACSILGVNAFDQPNVEISKKITKAKIADYQQKGKLDEGEPAWSRDGLKVYSPTRVHGDTLRTILHNYLENAQNDGYVAINAYLPRNGEMIEALQALRTAIRAKTGNAVTAGFGPRFQHSTGQFHKGGPQNALFIQITTDPAVDMEIPTQGLTFGTLIRAQALGDYEALIEAGRKVLRVHLPGTQAVGQLINALA
jgi:transaldolase/glucose-6-phosphate isomerase